MREQEPRELSFSVFFEGKVWERLGYSKREVAKTLAGLMKGAFSEVDEAYLATDAAFAVVSDGVGLDDFIGEYEEAEDFVEVKTVYLNFVDRCLLYFGGAV